MIRIQVIFLLSKFCGDKVKKFIITAIWGMSSLFLFASSASAQETFCVGAGCLLTTSSTSSSTSTILGAGVLLLSMTNKSAKTAMIEKYLRDNQVAVIHDLNVGAGGSIDDFAQAFGVKQKNRKTFNVMMRKHRVQLTQLANSKTLTIKRAGMFVDVIVSSMK